MQIRAALFDMDGLMIDSDRIISRSYETVLEKHGIKPKLNHRGIVHTPGISSRDNWIRLMQEYSFEADIDELIVRKTQLHTQFMKEGVDAMPGLFDVLKMLKERGIKMAIASSSTREIIDAAVKHLKIEDYFDAIVSGNEVNRGKPAPDIFLKAAEKLGVPPKECVVFEDAVSGVQAAKAAGMKCIAIPLPTKISNPEFAIADNIFPSLTSVSIADL